MNKTTGNANRNKMLQTVRQLYRSGNHAEGLRVCQQEAARFPGDVDFQTLTGQALLRLRRFGEAEDVFRDLMAKAPDSPGGYLGLAQVYFQMGEWEKSIEICVRARELKQVYRQVANLHGQALLKLQRIDEAEDVFGNLVALAPELPGGYLGLAQIYAGRADWEKGVEIGSLARMRQHHNPQITNLHGRALVELRRFTELRDLLSDYFQHTGIMDRQQVAGPAITDKRLASATLFDLYWKACIGSGDVAAAVWFQVEISNARAQGEAMATLFGGCAPHLPFFGNEILGDI